ncbi:MAG: DUF5719 family protein [Acidimicrobiales bacterium]
MSLAVVIAVVVAVAVVDAVSPAPAAPTAPASGDGVPVAPVGAYSSSAFCASGVGALATAAVYLTNSTPKPVRATMTSIGQAAGNGTVPTVQRALSVPPLGTLAVNPDTGLPGGDTASSFAFAGGGVVATQVVSGPNGWSTAPCATQTSPSWSFAGGSTSSGDSLTLSLFNPTASQSVVNVSFLTSTGLVAPQQYQGLTVPPGQLVDENVGDFVQDAPDITTLVSAEAGALVGTEFQQHSSGASGGVSLRLGSPALSTTWRFAQTTATTGSSVTFSLGNPGTSPVAATFSFGVPAGSVVPRRVAVPPQSVAEFSATGSGLPQQTPYSVTVTATGPIVVGRSVEASASATPPLWGSSSGTATTADGWLVPGPGSSGVPGTAGATIESLAVANPGSAPARVQVNRLDRTAPVAMFTVPPDEVTVLGRSQVSGVEVLSVSASQPVAVEEDSGPSGAPGVVSSTGFPVTGG